MKNVTPELAKRWSASAKFYNASAEKYLYHRENWLGISRVDSILAQPRKVQLLLRKDRRRSGSNHPVHSNAF